MQIVFWQNTPSIHQEPLLSALSNLGVDVFQYYESELPEERLNMGWNVRESSFSTKLISSITPSGVRELHAHAYHVFSGFGGFPAVRAMLNSIYKDSPRRCLIFAERPDPRGVAGHLRKLIYKSYSYWFSKIHGVLAAGSMAYFQPIWRNRSFPFSYFVRPPEIEPVQLANRRFRFIFIGSLCERKNVAQMVNVFPSFKEEADLVLIGNGPLEGELKNQVAQLDLQRQVHFRGSVPNHGIHRELAQADALVLPSFHDGYGVVVNEALQSGCRVACSTACGSSEYLVHFKDGWATFDPHDSTELHSAMAALLENGTVQHQERKRRQREAVILHPEHGARSLLRIINAPESLVNRC